MNIPWEQIFEIVVKLIEDCQEPDPAKVRSRLRGPGPLQKLRAERAVRTDMGLTPKQWRKDGAAIMHDIYAVATVATDDDLNELIDRAD